MKKYFYLLTFIFLTFFSFDVFAYPTVIVNTGSGTRYSFNPQSSNLQNINSVWSGGYVMSPSTFGSFWFLDAGQFWYNSNYNGNILDVRADYYVGFQMEMTGSESSTFTSYLNGSRNTLKAENLRCGFGDYGTGYDNTFVPNIGDFSVELDNSTIPFGGSAIEYQVRFRIRFHYNQQLSTVRQGSSNMSCWFERQPSNGLAAQFIPDGATTYAVYQVNSFNFSVSLDPNTSILSDIENGQQTIIDQNRQTQDKIDNINDSITNPNVDDPDNALNGMGDMISENGVITDLISLPITLFSKILDGVGSSCSQFSLGNLMGTNLTLPCINVSDYIGTSLWQIIDVLFSGFFVWKMSKKFIQVFQNMSSMEEGDVLG